MVEGAETKDIQGEEATTIYVLRHIKHGIAIFTQQERQYASNDVLTTNDGHLPSEPMKQNNVHILQYH